MVSEEARGLRLPHNFSCLLNFPAIHQQASCRRAKPVCALALCFVCLGIRNPLRAGLPPRSVRPPAMDAHGTWMMDEGVNPSNNKARGAQSQGSFSVLGYGCGLLPRKGPIMAAADVGTRDAQLKNALPSKTKGKSSKQRNKPPQASCSVE